MKKLILISLLMMGCEIKHTPDPKGVKVIHTIEITAEMSNFFEDECTAEGVPEEDMVKCVTEKTNEFIASFMNMVNSANQESNSAK